MAQCLTNVPNKNDTLAQSSSKLKFPGQSWTADDQCKMIYGSEASYCRVIIFFNSISLYIFI
jgi:hypothetical protein